MTEQEYLEVIDFSRLRGMAAKMGMSFKELSVKGGVFPSFVANMIHGGYLPSAERIAEFCGNLGCSVDDIMEFKGYEVKEFYKGKDPFVPHKKEDQCVYRVSYEPLRNLLFTVYGDRYEEKFRELLDKIPSVGGTEKQLEAMKKARGSCTEKKTSQERWKSYTKGMIDEKKRACFKHDRPLNLKVIYNLCKVLGCTPAWVLTYK